MSYNWGKAVTEEMRIALAPEKELAAKVIRAQMGLPSDCWYVALHVREKGFYKESEAMGGWRCADINNYADAIEYITGRGGWVVRMGDTSMKPLPKRQQVIDYPHTKYKSDLMDLYLIKHCRLYVGMNSGIWDVAHMFQKEHILLNSTNLTLSMVPKYGDFVIMKHYYSKSRKRFLSIKELLAEPFASDNHYAAEIPSADKTDYIFIENTPAEIQTLVSEKLNQRPDYSYNRLQALFLEDRGKQIKKWIEEEPFFEKYPSQAYRLAARYYYQGTIGEKYLNDNWEYGQYLADLTELYHKTGAIH
jgi:putative glycosyltransferase (TIGR04372 family)